MNKKAARIMLVFLLTVACAVTIGIAQGKKATLTGHLVDQMCGGRSEGRSQSCGAQQGMRVDGSLRVERLWYFREWQVRKV